MIVQRTGKLTVAQAKGLGERASTIINFVYRLEKLEGPGSSAVAQGHPSTNGLYAVLQGQPGDIHPFWLSSSQTVKGLGEPLVRVREFESSPGLWVFDDAQSKITFLIWSDGHKAKPWRGTSIEAICTDKQLPELVAAVNRLDEHLRLRHAEHVRVQSLAAAEADGPSTGRRKPKL